jgi:two-component system, NtrC family, sensor kinase
MPVFSFIQDITPVFALYFFYGLSFLFLGASIAIKDMKASTLRISGSLWLLSIFGFSHGLLEWVQLFRLVQEDNLNIQEMYWLIVASLLLALVSFQFLLQFGLSLIYAYKKKRIIKQFQLITLILFFIFIAVFFLSERNTDPLFLYEINLIIRRTFGFLGSSVAAYGLIEYSRDVNAVDKLISRFFLFTGIGFSFYGLFAGIIPSHTVLPYINIPIEVFRALSAVLITYFLMKGLNIFDIETRNKLESQIKKVAQSEKMASLGRLASGIAHEVNTPLTSASLNVQMLRKNLSREPDITSALEKLDAVERGINRASVIAKELLQLSHMKQTVLSPIDIEDVISNALEPLLYKLKKIKVIRTSSALPKVPGDINKLEQVIINIINNSIDAMPEGGVLTITTGLKKEKVKIEIKDTGIGISKNQIHNLFDPFYTTKEVGQGTGLGLSICFGIIEQHQGSIELSGKRGIGTTAKIQLPIN